MKLQLVIGNKNYSSWSMRPWVLLRQAQIPFEEVQLKFDESDGGLRVAGIEKYSAAGKVPVLMIDGEPVWDSLAICETVAELFPDKHLWPEAPEARARGALGLRRDALGLPGAARHDADEHPQPLSRQGPDARVAARTSTASSRSGPSAASASAARGSLLFGAFQRRRRLLRAGGDALPDLRRQGAARRAGVLRGGAGARRGARVDATPRAARRSSWPQTSPTPSEVKVYTVGGAVRDELLGLPVKERDYVVVGATPEEMVKQGFKPVGKDFPVFLHPQTHEEYALARTERKSGRGYKGFTVYAAPEVTLEEDLKRRDLTINAIAKAEDGTLIDPFGGQRIWTQEC